MKKFKRIISICIIVTLLAAICAMSTVVTGAKGTGAGLAEWALNAYYSGWRYVYGGASPGAVDCSGLIYSYAGGYRTGDAQTFNSSYIGYVSNGVPRIHGLGLYKPGHVGVYVGNEMAVDARGDEYGVCYESVYSHGWTRYFKVPGLSYPTTGWVKFSGADYYYENGQYLANTTRTIDGVTYSFSSSGRASTSGSSNVDTVTQTPNNTTNTTTTTAVQSTSLKKGSQGEAVEKLQKRLSELGYYNGAVDGDFGTKTEEAFKLFQKQAGLYVDGIAGSDADYLYSDKAPKYTAEQKSDDDEDQTTAIAVVDNKKTDVASTAANAVEDVNDESFEKGDYDDKIVDIQERLNELGYYDGYADGSFGSQTEEAVEVFQGANGITQTGIADSFTVEVLFSDEAKENPLQGNYVEASEVVTSELPASVLGSVAKVQPVTEAQVTEVELQTSKLSSKALSGFANNISFKEDSNGNNFQFILWLGVMIVVMLIAFAIVHAVEKKKSGKKASHRYF